MTLTFSNSSRWVPCSQSVSPVPADSRFTSERSKSESALEGEAWAWMVAAVLSGDAHSCDEFGGEHAPNGFPISGEMIRHGAAYVAVVTKHGEPIAVETDLELWGGLVRGRPDASGVTRDNCLHVYDGKFGFRLIEPKEHWQLVLAGLALVQPHHTMVSFEIFQPRPYHPDGPHRKWVIGRKELDDYSAYLYHRASLTIATRQYRPEATVGRQCDYCPRRTACPTLNANIYSQYETLKGDSLGGRLGADDLSARLRFLNDAEALLRACKTGVEAEIEGRLKSGEFVPGWLLEDKLGHAAWTVEPSAVAMLTGVETHKSVLKTPAQLIAEGANESTVKLLSKRPRVGTRLTEATAKIADRIFGKA